LLGKTRLERIANIVFLIMALKTRNTCMTVHCKPCLWILIYTWLDIYTSDLVKAETPVFMRELPPWLCIKPVCCSMTILPPSFAARLHISISSLYIQNVHPAFEVDICLAPHKNNRTGDPVRIDYGLLS
jgi:hypothetical protein